MTIQGQNTLYNNNNNDNNTFFHLLAVLTCSAQKSTVFSLSVYSNTQMKIYLLKKSERNCFHLTINLNNYFPECCCCWCCCCCICCWSLSLCVCCNLGCFVNRTHLTEVLGLFVRDNYVFYLSYGDFYSTIYSQSISCTHE